MTPLNANEIAPLLLGHVDLRHRPGSVQPLRLPVAEFGFYDPFNRWVASCAAGCRLRFATSSRSIRLTGALRLLAGAPSDELRGAFDLFVEGALFARAWAEGGAAIDLESGRSVGDDAFAVSFKGLPAGDKLVDLWLPQAATVSLTGLSVDEGAAVALAPDPRRKILFHGSSITHCMEAQGASAGWPAVAASWRASPTRTSAGRGRACCRARRRGSSATRRPTPSS